MVNFYLVTTTTLYKLCSLETENIQSSEDLLQFDFSTELKKRFNKDLINTQVTNISQKLREAFLNGKKYSTRLVAKSFTVNKDGEIDIDGDSFTLVYYIRFILEIIEAKKFQYNHIVITGSIYPTDESFLVSNVDSIDLKLRAVKEKLKENGEKILFIYVGDIQKNKNQYLCAEQWVQTQKNALTEYSLHEKFNVLPVNPEYHDLKYILENILSDCFYDLYSKLPDADSSPLLSTKKTSKKEWGKFFNNEILLAFGSIAIIYILFIFSILFSNQLNQSLFNTTNTFTSIQAIGKDANNNVTKGKQVTILSNNLPFSDYQINPIENGEKEITNTNKTFTLTDPNAKTFKLQVCKKNLFNLPCKETGDITIHQTPAFTIGLPNDNAIVSNPFTMSGTYTNETNTPMAICVFSKGTDNKYTMIGKTDVLGNKKEKTDWTIYNLPCTSSCEFHVAMVLPEKVPAQSTPIEKLEEIKCPGTEIAIKSAVFFHAQSEIHGVAISSNILENDPKKVVPGSQYPVKKDYNEKAICISFGGKNEYIVTPDKGKITIPNNIKKDSRIIVCQE